MNKKYKLTDEKKDWLGTTLYRIEALKDFSFVKKGDKGGFIEKESNLNISGDAWVSGKINLKNILCSRFSFEFDSQVKLWQKMEEQFKRESAKLRK